MAKALIQKESGNDAVDDLRRKVQAIFAKQADLDSQDVDAMSALYDFEPEQLEKLAERPAEELAALGINKRKIRIAIDAKLPNKQVPFALKALHERHLARIRRVDDAEGLVRLGFAIGQLPARSPRRDDSEVITVEATEVK